MSDVGRQAFARAGQSRSVRVALVTETFQPSRATPGADVFRSDRGDTTVRAVADRLLDTGHQVLLVAAGPGLPSHRGARVVRVEKPGRRARVGRALADFGADLVHVSSPGPLGLRALEHARALRIPSLLAQQDPVPDLTAGHWSATTAARADRVLVTATWMRRRLSQLGVPAQVWSPGVDSATFTPVRRDHRVRGNWSRDGQVLVGYAGALRNRHHIRPLADLGAVPGTRLVVAGDGPQRRWLQARLPDARFLGVLGTDDLALTLANLDLLVHPASDQTCCHLLRAAAASGVPVVAPAAGGALDVVRPLETGLLYAPDQPCELVRAVGSLVADRSRGLMGEHARMLAEWRTWADAVEELVTDHYLPLLGLSRAA